jgi:hypothetical protein
MFARPDELPGFIICAASTPRHCCGLACPVHVLAARLGHADPSMTLRVHAHVISAQLAEAAVIFARAIGLMAGVGAVGRPECGQRGFRRNSQEGA